MSKTLRRAALAIAIGLLLTGLVSARVMQQGERCSVPAGSTVQGTLFVFCQHLTIAGRVEGNVIGIGLRAEITGEVAYNVYLAGLELTLGGRIERDLHYIGLTLATTAPDMVEHAPIGGQAIFAALSAHLGAGTRLTGPVTGSGYQILIDGDIAGEVNYWGSAFVLTGSVEGDVYAAVRNPEDQASDLETLLLPLEIELAALTPGLLIADGARISGDLEYTGPSEGDIAGTVVGAITRHSATLAIVPVLPDEGLATIFADRFKQEFTVLVTAGLLVLTLASRQVHSALRPLRRRPVASFVIGMLLFILSFPVTLILALITAFALLALALLRLDGVLLVVGAFLTLVDIGLVGIFYFSAIFIARAVVALGLGRLLLHLAVGLEASRRMPRLSLFIGVIALSLLTSLPVVGFVFNAGALFMGLGAISTVSLRWLRRLRQRQPHDHAGGELALARSSDPPVASDPAAAARQTALPPGAPDKHPGLADLPPGFDRDFFFSDD